MHRSATLSVLLYCKCQIKIALHDDLLIRSDGGLHGVDIPLLADKTGDICRKFGVLTDGCTIPALFLLVRRSVHSETKFSSS
jgi:hypothetical protein